VQLSRGEIAQYFRIRVPDLKQRGKEWRGPCPIHKGKDDNFAVNSETGAAYCHSQCQRGWGVVELEAELRGISAEEAFQSVKDILGIPTEKQPPRQNSERKKRGTKQGDGFEEKARYVYEDEKGSVLFEVVRLERNAPDGRAKRFFQRHQDSNGQWVPNMEGVRRVLYHLPEVLASDSVFIVEGEKDVETLRDWGLVATCNPMGALKWQESYSATLAGKDVILIPDTDEKGKEHGRKVCASVRKFARSIRIVELPFGKDVTEWKERGGTQQALEKLANVAQPSWSQQSLLDRFRDVDDSVLWMDDKGHEHFLCSAFTVIGQTHNRDDANYGKLIEFRSAQGKTKRAIILDAALIGDSKDAPQQLADLGLRIGKSRFLIGPFKEYLGLLEASKSILIADRTGWHDGAFVLPDETFLESGYSANDVLYNPSASHDHLFRRSGSLDEWRAHVGRYADGNSRLLLAASAAFAAPVLDLFEASGFGFHFRGLSSTGKTTALLVAGSIVGGNRQKGFIRPWRATQSGHEAIAAQHNDSLLCLDEIREMDERALAEIIYMYMNGLGKGRMTKHLSAAPISAFRVLILSTGEETVAQMLQRAGKRTKGGQEARLIDIAADAGSRMGMFEHIHRFENPSAFARELSANSKRYFGSAIRQFLRMLVSDRNAAAEFVRRERERFVKRLLPPSAAGEIHRVVASFGLVAAVGELATEWGITGWNAGSSFEGVARCFQDWVRARGGYAANDVEHGVAEVLSFLAEFGNSRFSRLPPDLSEPRISKRAGFYEKSDNETVYYIFSDVFQREVLKEYDSAAVCAELEVRGLLRPRRNGAGHYSIQKRLPDLGKTRVYPVRLVGSYNASTSEDDDEETLETLETVETYS